MTTSFWFQERKKHGLNHYWGQSTNSFFFSRQLLQNIQKYAVFLILAILEVELLQCKSCSTHEELQRRIPTHQSVVLAHSKLWSKCEIASISWIHTCLSMNCPLGSELLNKGIFGISAELPLRVNWISYPEWCLIFCWPVSISIPVSPRGRMDRMFESKFFLGLCANCSQWAVEMII